MKRTLRTKIWCAVLAVACVSGVAFGAANLPRVQAEAVSGGIKVTEAPMTKKEEYRAAREKFESAEERCFPSADLTNVPKIVKNEDGGIAAENGSLDFSACVGGELAVVVDEVPRDVQRHPRRGAGVLVHLRGVLELLERVPGDAGLAEHLEAGAGVAESPAWVLVCVLAQLGAGTFWQVGQVDGHDVSFDVWGVN